MRSTYTLNPDLVDDDFKERNSHLGEFYHTIGFRNSVESNVKPDRAPRIGYLMIGPHEVGMTKGQAMRVCSELQESLFSHVGRSRDHKPGTVQTPDYVPVLHQDYSLTVAEINKIREILVDAGRVYEMSAKLVP